MNSKMQGYLLSAIVTLVLVATSSFAQTPKTAPLTSAQRQAMIEQHAKIAELHTQMAACLKSDKAPADCRTEMIATCSNSLGDRCPMLGGNKKAGRGRGRMGGNCGDWMPVTEP